MKRNKKAAIVMGLLMATTVSAGAAMLTMTGCDPEPPAPTTHTLGNGDYYQDVNGVEHKLTINGSSFVMAFGAEERTGTYTYDGSSAITFKFSDDNTTVEASYDDGSISFTYNGVAYELIPMTEFTVTFELSGGTGTNEVKVINGRTIEKPANPTKTGQVFVGWYSDAAFAKAFDFENTPITGNITLYARYVAQAEGEFTLSFDAASAGQTIADVKTAGKQVFDSMLPVLQAKDGKQFLGWWTSDYEDGTKLTAQVADGQTVDENMTLYAVWEGDVPALSVNGTGISWSSAGVGAQYRLTVTGPDGDKIVNDRAESGTSMALDFSAQAAGDYVVTLTVNGKTATAYYKNKGLARVSLFSVEGSVLTFNEVAGATAYYISVDCDNPAHNTNEISLEGAAYDFSECNMESGPIKFTVRATGEGYVDSVAEYSFERTLGTTAVSVDSATDKLTWTAVENAESYKVTVKSGDATDSVTVNANQENSVDLSKYYGELEISVTPYNHGWLSPEAAQTTYNKTRLATPSNIRASGNSIVWDEVEDAISYTVTINGKVQTVTSASIDLSGQELDDIVVTVQAVAAVEANNSFTSPNVSIARELTGLIYDAGKISWNSVIGVSKYGVRVNGGQEIVVEDATSQAITLTQKGTNTIEVRFYIDDEPSAWQPCTVNAGTLTLDKNDGNGTKTEQYYAAGDPITLPSDNRLGYTFVGWSTSAQDGQMVSSGTLFETDKTYYAVWDANEYKVNLVIPENEGSFSDGTTTDEAVREYGSSFTLPVPESSDLTKVFGGWFTEPNGVGTRFTDVEGVSVASANVARDVTLYPAWLSAFEFTEIDHPTIPGQKAYSVSQGQSSSVVRKLRIPAKYNGLPVTTVEGGCFMGCSNLQVVEIPDSIVSIYVGSEGSNTSGSAFQSCNSLQEIVIYDASSEFDTKYDIYYSSANGALLHNNEFTGVELAYVPRGINGTFEIPETVVVLPQYIFAGTNVDTIMVPASVATIYTHAFDSSKIDYIVFATYSEGEEVPLVLAEEAFGNASITELTLPSRVAEINSSTFGSCDDLQAINISGGGGKYTSANGMVLTDNGTTLYYCPIGRSGKITIPSGVTQIAEKAFFECDKITSVVISEGVTEIGKEAFSGCSNLSSVTFNGDANSAPLAIREKAFYGNSLTELVLPENLTVLEKHAFGSGSKTLTKVTVNAASAQIEYANGAFATIDSTAGTGIGSTYITDLFIGPKVVALNIAGVFGEANLVNVTVDPANTNYSSLDNVVFNYDKTEILYYPAGKMGDYAIPDSVEVIGANVFYGKNNLSSITIGWKVRQIGDGAFAQCLSLEKVIFEATPAGEESVPLTIGADAFYNCRLVKSFDLPERITEIGNGAFSACVSLESIVIPEGVTKLGVRLFARSNMLTSVTLPASLTEIAGGSENDTNLGAALFEDTSALAQIIMTGDGVGFGVVDNVLYGKDKNGELAVLYYSPELNRGDNGTVTIPSTVTEIKDKAFLNNAYIERVIFEDLTSGASLKLGVSVFSSDYYGTSGIRYVDLPSGLTEIPAGTFAETLIEEISIPNTVTNIGEKAFYKCANLSSVKFDAGGTAPLVIADGKSETESLSGGTVTQDVEGVFVGCTSLKEIAFPERTTVIGSFAFSHASATTQSGNSTIYYDVSNLESVTLPSTLIRIGNNAFQYAEHLERVTFTEGVKWDTEEGETATGLAIEASAFVGTGVLAIALPDGTVSIGNSAFEGSGLQSVSLPASLETLGDSAFSECGELKTVTIADGCKIVSIGNYTFEYTQVERLDFAACSELTTIGQYIARYSPVKEVTLPASIEVISASAFQYASKLEKVEFKTAPDEDGVARSNIENIANYAFKGTAIKEFVFPETTADSITLGTKIFEGCSQLTKIHLSTGVTSLGSALTGANFIETISIADSNANLKADAAQPLILNVDGTVIRLAYGAVLDEGEGGEYRIPEGITEIGDSAFKGQNSIKKLIIPASVETIGNNAFQYCRMLETVEFAENSALVSIGNYAFGQCFALNSVSLPANLLSIGNYAFYGDTSLKKIVTPAATTKFGTNVFAYSGLEEVTITNYKNQSGGTGATMFSNCVNLKKVTLGENVTEIASSMFKGCTSLTSIDLKNITKINGNAFQDSGIVEVILGENLTELGQFVFDGCLNLNAVKAYVDGKVVGEIGEIVLPDSVTKLGNKVFYEATLLKKVTFGENITSLGTELFAKSTIEEAYLNLKGVTKLPNKMFNACASLKKVVLSQNITATGTDVFRDCTSLRTVQYYDENGAIVGEEGTATLPASITNLGNYTFETTGIEKVKISHDITTIGTYIFAACTNLKYVDMTGCTTIGNYMFQGCTALEEAMLPNILSLGAANKAANCFSGCTALKRVVLSANLTEIGRSVFDGCTSLATIDYMDGSDIISGGEGVAKLPETLTGMGYYAFRETAFREVIIPRGVTYIGGSATSATTASYMFQDCVNLEKVIVHDALTAVGRSTFAGCDKLKTLQYVDANGELHGEEGVCTLPEGVTMIGQKAFSGTGFEKAIVPSTARTFSTYTFENCENLVEVEYLAEASGTYMFYGCANLKSVTFSSKLAGIANYMFYGCELLDTIKVIDADTNEVTGEDGSVTLPASLVEIGGHAFWDAASLTNVTLPEGLQEIGAYAFVNSGVRAITIPASVKSLGELAFFNTTITLAGGNTAYINDNGAIVSVTGEIVFVPLSYTGEFTLPEGTTLGSNVLNNHNNITKVTLSTDQLVSYSFDNYKGEIVVTLGQSTVIPSRAFSGYDGTSITLPEGITEIGTYAFENCAGLKTIDLPSTITKIGMSAFADATGLESIVIPENVTELDQSYIFDGCTSLKSVTLPSKLTSMYGMSMFRDCVSLESISIPDTVTEIGQQVFSGCISLREVNVPAGSTIGSGAFEDCVLIEKAVIPEGAIGGQYYNGCTNVKEIVYLPAVVNSSIILFSGLENVEKITFGEKVTVIPSKAFQNLASVKSVSLPEGLTTINSNAFDGTGITSLVIPTTVTTIGSNAFANMASLQTVYLPANLAALGSSMFKNDAALSKLYLYELDENGEMVVLNDVAEGTADLSVFTTIAGSCFEGCTSLKNVIFSEELTTISGLAFADSGLESVTLPQSVTSITTAFQGCTALKELILPASVVTVSASAFSGWTEEQKIVIYVYALDSACSWVYNWANECEAQIEYRIIYEGDAYGNVEEDGTSAE